jgi:RNA-dependent RNA polymerase
MTSDKLKQFFFDFVNTDNLGIIANAHLALADESPQKALDSRCVRLAQMHSTAVDFAKTGVSNQIPKDLKPKRYPDFMENKNKEEYKSEKVIGKLYRQARDYAPEEQDLNEWSQQEPASELRPLAEDLLAHYETALSTVMNIFNISSEAEVLSGEVAKFSKFYSNNQKKRREDTRAKLKVLIAELIHSMRIRFDKVAAGSLELAQECRYLAYSQRRSLGFPWVTAGHVLLQVPTTNHSSQ